MIGSETWPRALNGIEDIVTRPDLADRAVFLTLEPLYDDRRRPEAELWAAFEAEAPRILGALLDAVVEGLRRLPQTHLKKLPRMADFALWATACETALWPAGTFWSAYGANRDQAVDSAIDADPVAAAVRTMMAVRTMWTGTASDLLNALAAQVGERVTKAKMWPDSPRALASRLRRVATCLRSLGIEMVFGEREGRARNRIIQITANTENAGSRPSAPSTSSARVQKSNGSKDLAVAHTAATQADSKADDHAADPAVRPLMKLNGRTDADGVNAKMPRACQPGNDADDFPVLPDFLDRRKRGEHPAKGSEHAPE